MNMSDKDVIFLYGWGPEEEGRLSSLLYMSETAAIMNMNPIIFLFTDGAVLARKGISTNLSEKIGMRFKNAIKNKNLKFYVCEEAARKRSITQENLEEDITIIGYSTFLDIATTSKTVITI